MTPLEWGKKLEAEWKRMPEQRQDAFVGAIQDYVAANHGLLKQSAGVYKSVFEFVSGRPLRRDMTNDSAVSTIIDQLPIVGEDTSLKPRSLRPKKHLRPVLFWLCHYHPEFAKEALENVGLWFESTPDDPELPARPQVRSHVEQRRSKPSLRLERFKASDAPETKYALRFDQRATDFVGREDEWTELLKFMDASADDSRPRFRWWQISGDAGQGKSRLALSLIDKYHDNEEVDGVPWEAGFASPFDQKFVDDFRDSKLDRPLLIVIDYVVAPDRVELLTKMFTAIFQMIGNAEDNLVVRLLILNRTPFAIQHKTDAEVLAQQEVHHQLGSMWYAKLVNNGAFGSSTITACFRPYACHLTEPSDGDLLRIAESWLAHTSDLEGMDEIQKARFCKSLGLQLYNHQPGGEGQRGTWTQARRPLFAMIAAEAAADDSITKDLNFEGLLQYTIDQEEREFFTDQPKTEQQENLALLANMMGQVALPDLPDDLVGDGFFSALPTDIDASLRILGYSGSLKSVRALREIPARQPDILAEYQLLAAVENVVNGSTPAPPIRETGYRSSNRLKILARISWGCNPEATASFVSRFAEDFIHCAPAVFEHLVPEFTFDEVRGSDALSRAQGQAIGKISSCYSLQGQVELAHKWLERLSLLANVYAHDADLRLSHAIGISALSIAMSSIGKVEDSRVLYESLASIAEAHKEESDLRSWQAAAITGLLCFHGRLGDLKRALNWYKKLIDLAHQNPKRPLLRGFLARGMAAMSSYMGRVGHVDQSIAISKNLSLLISHYPEQLDLRRWQALSMSSVSIFLADAKNFEHSENWCADLKMLVEEYPMLREPKTFLGAAMGHLSQCFGNAGNLDKCHDWCKNLSDYARSNPNDTELNFLFGKCAASTSFFLREANDLVAADEWYQVLVELVERYPQLAPVLDALRKTHE